MQIDGKNSVLSQSWHDSSEQLFLGKIVLNFFDFHP